MNFETCWPVALQPAVFGAPRRSRKGGIPRLLLIASFLIGGSSWIVAQGQFPGNPQPAFGILTTSPSNIVFNTPTTVTFTIFIDTPTLNPTSVELQRVDAAGQFLSTNFRLRDDGTGGDQKPGDRIFTARVTLIEPTVSRQQFRVVAAFRGNRQNAHSDVAFVDVDPFSLPPDPGQAGKNTIEGIDSDLDGVRDDVQRWIAIAHPADPQARTTLNGYAEISQEVILSTDKLTVIPLMLKQSRAAACWDRQYPADDRRTLRQLREQFVNTDERFRAYLDSQRLVSGESFRTFVNDPSVCEQ